MITYDISITHIARYLKASHVMSWLVALAQVQLRKSTCVLEGVAESESFPCATADDRLLLRPCGRCKMQVPVNNDSWTSGTNARNQVFRCELDPQCDVEGV
jgi:hypothetical protein